MKDLVSFIPILLLVVVFYLLALRPARARQREFARVQEQLAVGNRVMLASGIFGTLVEVGDDEARLEIAPQVVVTVKRQAIATVIEQAGQD